MNGLQQYKDYESDIKGRWYEQDLEDAVAWGLLRGDDKGNLRPKDPISRAELAAVIARLVQGGVEQRIRDKMRSVVYIQTRVEGGIKIGSGAWVAPWIAITNAHVVYDDETGQLDPANIGVFGNPGARFSPIDPMTVNKAQIDHANDLAILWVDRPWYAEPGRINPAECIPLSLGDDPRQGDTVYALGHPFNMPWDMSKGIVRSTERYINYWQKTQHVLGLTVPINSGNSGGALLNVDGELVGIPSAGVRNANSFTFAVPVSKVKELMEVSGV